MTMTPNSPSELLELNNQRKEEEKEPNMKLLFGELTGALESALLSREKRVKWDKALLEAISVESGDGDDEESRALHTGHLWAENLETEVDWNQLVDGLEQVLPATIHGLSEGDPDAEVLGHFAEAGHLNCRGMLHQRFGHALNEFDAPFLVH